MGAMDILFLVVVSLSLMVVDAGQMRSAAAGNTQMKLTLFANATARKATCNDGTPSGYYVWKPPQPSNKWIIYLEGGGACWDVETCLKRPKFLTSSTPWPKVLAAEGLLGNGTTNKFAGFNKIVVIYCTSDLYTGTAAKGSVVGLPDWRFHGSHVVPAVLEDLHSELLQASEVLFTGGSAGGIGTFMNYPLVKAALPHAHVRALPDAGWFLTTMKPYSKKVEPLGKSFKEGMALWKGMPPRKCVEALNGTSSDPALCYSGPVVYNFMPSPQSDIMVCKAQTDAWTVGHDGVKAPYNGDEIVWLTELAAQTRATFILDKVGNVFSADCLYHTSLQILWDKITVGNTTLHQAVERWYFDGQTVHLVDSCETFCCNGSCL